MKSIVPLAAVALASHAAPASAHWQFTRWGMTPEQVIAASSGQAHATAQPDTLAGTYAAGGRTYQATFRFVQGRLGQVELELQGEPVCQSMATDVATIYGSPNRKTIGRYGTGVAEWFDYVNGNDVVLAYLVKSCTMSYGPLATGASTGL